LDTLRFFRVAFGFCDFADHARIHALYSPYFNPHPAPGWMPPPTYRLLYTLAVRSLRLCNCHCVSLRGIVPTARNLCTCYLSVCFRLTQSENWILVTLVLLSWILLPSTGTESVE
jgi:hypothetical protein